MIESIDDCEAAAVKLRLLQKYLIERRNYDMQNMPASNKPE